MTSASFDLTQITFVVLFIAGLIAASFWILRHSGLQADHRIM